MDVLRELYPPYSQFVPGRGITVELCGRHEELTAPFQPESTNTIEHPLLTVAEASGVNLKESMNSPTPS